MKLRHLSTLLIAFLLLTTSVAGQVFESKNYNNGLVVSAEKHASEIGNEILQQGGNAVDAEQLLAFPGAQLHAIRMLQAAELAVVFGQVVMAGGKASGGPGQGQEAPGKHFGGKIQPFLLQLLD